MADRDALGRWLPGWGGGPGRPRKTASVERAYLETLVGEVPLAEWVLIVRAAREQAKNGDHRAREWISRNLIGEDPLGAREQSEELARLREEIEALKEAQGNGSGRFH